MINMFLSNNPSLGDINLSNLSCWYLLVLYSMLIDMSNISAYFGGNFCYHSNG